MIEKGKPRDKIAALQALAVIRSRRPCRPGQVFQPVRGKRMSASKSCIPAPVSAPATNIPPAARRTGAGYRNEDEIRAAAGAGIIALRDMGGLSRPQGGQPRPEKIL